MLTTLITISAMFSIILISHNYMLEAMHADALDELKSRTDSPD